MDLNKCCAINNSNKKRCKNKKSPYSHTGFCTLHITRNAEHYKTDTDCSICLIEVKNPYILKSCNHMFCTNCIFNWLYYNNTCPCCRTVVYGPQITRAVLYGMVNNHISYVYKYTFDSAVLNESEYSLIIEYFEINKEYYFDEWNNKKIILETLNLEYIYEKMPYTFQEYIMSYNKNFLKNNTLFIII
jgi:hypothetical protein